MSTYLYMYDNIALYMNVEKAPGNCDVLKYN